MFELRDCAETLLINQQPRNYRGATLLIPFRPRAGLAACPAALGQLPHGHLGLLVLDVDVRFERLLVDVADPATERKEVHSGEDGDRAEERSATAT